MNDIIMNDFESLASCSPKETPGGRILCLDVGDKRIGMAMSDPLGIIAQGMTTLMKKGIKADIRAIAEMIESYEVTTVIYGLPKNMNGSLGPQAEKTEEFIEKLRHSIPCAFIPWDERLTTVHAHNTLKEAGMSRKKRSSKVDTLSAVLILQNYLDQRNQRREMKNPACGEGDY